VKRQKVVSLVLMSMSVAATPIPAADQAVFASRETATALVELFTSEGCSSCPPADIWMSRLKSNPDLWKAIVPIVFHVDYWDGLGWADRFATPEFTQRQRRYASSWPTGAVYTPAFVVNGKEWLGFFKHESPPKSPLEKVGVLTVAIKEDKATATFLPQNSIYNPVKLELAWLGTDLQSDVKRGENSGRKLHHDFVVLHLDEIDMVNQANHWTGSLSLIRKAVADGPTAIAAWVTSGADITPIQATGGWLNSATP
jgi:hypothetical protein